MKKARKNAIIIFGISLFTAFILLGSVLYITRYRVTVVDTVRSKEGTYEAVLQAVGDPAWPFGSAPGRLVLKKDGRTLSKTDIEIANDGGRINDGNWKAAWRDDRAEITLSGQEQYDEFWLYIQDKQKRLGVQAPLPLIRGDDLLANGLTSTHLFKQMLDEAYDLQLQGLSKEKILRSLRKYEQR